MPFDSVVIGHAPSAFGFDDLNAAFHVLMGEDVPERPSSRGTIPFIATHKAKYFASSISKLPLRPEPFVAALEHATGLTVAVVGKPTQNFVETVIRSFDGDERSARGHTLPSLEMSLRLIWETVPLNLDSGAF